MMRRDDSPPVAVVGIDGSRAAVSAALWAVDEAVRRDIPLRLVYAIDPVDTSPEEEDAHRLATAEHAVRHALIAVESTERGVKIEVEITHGRPVDVLRRASRSAAMVCVGALGLHHFSDGHVGSTAKALALTAHCPVAVVRGAGYRRTETGWVVAEIDESAESTAVLQLGVDEAVLRSAPLRVLTSWSSESARGESPAATETKLATSRLGRRLDRWQHRHPELDVKAEVVHGSCLDYLSRNSRNIQLVVLGAHDRSGIEALVASNGHSALHDSDASILIAERRRL